MLQIVLDVSAYQVRVISLSSVCLLALILLTLLACVNASGKTQELNGLSTFYPPRVKVSAKCVSGDLECHVFQKFRHFLEDTIIMIYYVFVLFTQFPHSSFSVLILT